jgi:hypothetical protein
LTEIRNLALGHPMQDTKSRTFKSATISNPKRNT